MAADVVQRAQLAIFSAHDDQRHAGNLGDDMVADSFQLRGMGNQLPAVREDGAAVAFEAFRRRVARCR